jgi:hypothetical protein
MNAVARWFVGPSGAVLVGLAHALFLLALLAHQGVATDKEALKYLGAAHDTLHGDAHDLLARYRLYSGYVLFLLPFVAVGLPHLAVLAQAVLGLLAARALERMVRQAGGAAVAARGAMALYLLAYPVQQWTLTLYSEGLFIPLTVLFAERALRDTGWSPSLVLLALLVIITRPTGAFVALPLLLLRDGSAPQRWVALAATVLLMFLAPILPRDQLEGMAQQHVVLGFPERPDAVVDPDVRSLAGVQAAALADRGLAHWVCLVGRRIGSLYNPTRPWFSPLHNALVAPLFALYPLALVGIWRRRQAVNRCLAVVLALNTLLVGLTYDEWGGRFLAPLIPWLLVLAASAFTPKIRPTTSVPAY